jgi:2-polyprenyl-3-methyl-5-hydroxy-6-metoxy-1,4-benzoquinol methylase
LFVRRYSPLEWTPELVRKFWEYEAQFSHYYCSDLIGDLIVQKLWNFLKNKNVILDYGCGPGFLIDRLLKAGLNTAGTDVSRATVELVFSKFRSNPKFLGCYLPEELLGQDKKYDAILLVEVVEHLGDDVLREVLNNVKSLLAKNGIVVITTPNDERLDDSHVFCPNCEKVFHRWQHVRSWNTVALPNYLGQHGFATVSCFAFDVASLKKNQLLFYKNVLKRILRVYKDPKLACVARLAG